MVLLPPHVVRKAKVRVVALEARLQRLVAHDAHLAFGALVFLFFFFTFFYFSFLQMDHPSLVFRREKGGLDHHDEVARCPRTDMVMHHAKIARVHAPSDVRFGAW